MLWKGRRESENVVDERRMGGGKTIGLGGLLLGGVVYVLMGGDPLVYLAQNIGNLGGTQSSSGPVSAQDDERKKFVSVILADTEDVFKSQFAAVGKTYQEPSLVLFRDQVRSACGNAASSMGPFYCPGDARVYLDLSFFDELSRSLGARGDFAMAYVVAHEIGHHVQNLLGFESRARKLQSGMNEVGKNQISVQLELQADCFAGVWAKQTQSAKNVLEPGDVEEAMGAASAVGDDRLQQRSQGHVVPDSFTHGSSAQRVKAFDRGYSSGTLQGCLGQ
jgi:uncharacterized protein